MGDGLTLEKAKVVNRLENVETSVLKLDSSVQEIKSVLFGEKGEKGVVATLHEIAGMVKKGVDAVIWTAKLILGALLLAALPSITAFISMIMNKPH